MASSASSTTSKRYAPPKPAPLPEDYEEFYAGLTEAEKELDELAKEWLGSSYFIQWSHMYTKWSKTQEKTKAERIKSVSEAKST
jgi:hypothetical protein